jgi:VWFA-related protein
MGFVKNTTNLLLPLLLGAMAASQVPRAHDEKDTVMTFTSRTDLVLVPVVVTDKAGTHITGLAKNDFELEEDGEAKPIANLEEVRTGTSRVTRSMTRPGVYSNELAGDSKPKRLTIFVLDLVNTPFLDQSYAREQLVKYLAKAVNSQEPSALVAIGANGLKVLHDFNTDPAVLVAALKKTTGETAVVRSASPNEAGAEVNTLLSASDRRFNADQINGEAQRLMRFINGSGPDAGVEIIKRGQAMSVTLQAFEQLAEALSGIPGRKSLIWATASFVFALDPASGTLYGRALQMLNNANIAVYPVDARGLVVSFPGADVSRIEGLISYDQTLFEGSRDAMDNLAAMTGGQAFYNRNDLEVAFKKAVDDSASYYLLGYYLDKNEKPGWHNLHIKLRAIKSEVRARSGFFVTPEAKQTDIRRMDVSLALLSPLDSTALPVSVGWSGVQADGSKKKIYFEIDVPPESKIVDATKNGLLDLRVVVAARYVDGKPADQFSQSVHLNLKGEALQEFLIAGLNYKNELHLAAGEYSVRFVVRDNLTGRVGSVTAPLQVAP